MSSDHVTKSIEDLTQAGELAITTVMGPATADLQALLTTDSTLLTELAAAAQKATADGLEQSDLARGGTGHAGHTAGVPQDRV